MQFSHGMFNHEITAQAIPKIQQSRGTVNNVELKRLKGGSGTQPVIGAAKRNVAGVSNGNKPFNVVKLSQPQQTGGGTLLTGHG